MGLQLFRTTQLLGFTPSHLVGYVVRHEGSFFRTLSPLLTAMFLHGNLLHLLLNVIFLLIFGSKVEEVQGHGRFLLFYLACGVGAAFIYFLFSPRSPVPLIGASGAIAGVMAAFFSLFPGEPVTTLLILSWASLQFIVAVFSSINQMAGKAGYAW